MPHPLRFRIPTPDHLGIRYWIRVILLLVLVGVLTWYAKFRPHVREASHNHGMVAWMVPTAHGIGSYVIFPDDGKENLERTGLRILVNPPKNAAAFEQGNPAYYRGPILVLLGTTDSTTRNNAAALLDSGQEQLSHWHPSLGGNDVQSVFFDSSDSSPSLGLRWNGYAVRWWATRAEAEADSLADSLSVGILAECVASLDSLPHLHSTRVKALIYCGPVAPDSTRIGLGAADEGALFAEMNGTLQVKRIHLHWKPNSQ